MNKRRWPERKEKMKLESVGKSVRHAYIQKSGSAGGGGEKNTTREGIYMYVGVEFCGRGCRKAHCPSVLPLSDMGPQLSL
jgi:hypothetical protein